MATKTNIDENVTIETSEAKFTKDKLVASKKFANRKDVLNALLEDGKEYSTTEAETLIENFMKKEVI